MFNSGSYRLYFRDGTTEENTYTSDEARAVYDSYKEASRKRRKGLLEEKPDDIIGMMYLGELI